VTGLAAYVREPLDPALPPLDPAALGDPHAQDLEPLVYATLTRAGQLARQSADVEARLVRAWREARLLEPFRRDETVRVLDALEAAGVRPLLFKGTPLAYRCYPEPWLRPRNDTDLLIRASDEPRAARALEDLGYTRRPRPSGEHVTHQSAWTAVRSGLHFEWDVHWKLSDPQVFADLFPYDSLASRAVAVPALGGAARTVDDVDALLVACVHRVAHHYDQPTLIFLYDVALLADRVTAASRWLELTERAKAAGIAAVTRRGLDLARSLLNAAVPADVVRSLDRASPNEPTAAYLKPSLRKIDILKSDLSRLAWRGRLRLLSEHLFPPRDYMIRKYGDRPRVPLPLLYAARIFSGALSWFKPLG